MTNTTNVTFNVYICVLLFYPIVVMGDVVGSFTIKYFCLIDDLL